LNKNIIFIFSELNKGGGFTFTKSIFINLKDNMKFICNLRNSSISDSIIRENNFYKLNIWEVFKKKNKILVFNSQLSLLTSIFNITGTNFYIAHGAGNNFKYFNFFRKIIFILQINFPWLDKVIACGPTEYFNLKRIIYLNNSKLVKINVSVHPNLYNLKYTLSNSLKYNLCFIGKIIPQKGIDILLKSLKLLNNYKKFSVTLYTDYKLSNKSKYALHIQELLYNLKGNIEIKYPMPIKSINFGLYDYVVIPSRFEGLPSLIIELGMNKIPMIVSDCDGIKELFEFNDLCVFKNEDYKDLARILSNIQQLYLKKDDISNKLKMKILNDHSYDDFINSYLNLFNSK